LAVERLNQTINATGKRAGPIAPTAMPTRPKLPMQEARPPSEIFPKFDVVRLDPEGASVFAGRAAPNQLVTILINGNEFARARADSDGQWAVVVERSIPSGQVELALTASGPEPGRTDRGQVVHVTVATLRVASVADEVRSPAKTKKPLQPKAAELDAKQALGRFKAFVDRARVAAAERPAAPSVQTPVPVPITFLTAEATMTSDGEKAAHLLAEYLRITKPHSIDLTGHADSRGPDGYNLELSRRRLAAIKQFLRAAGYEGGLKLVPLGESAPYRLVDRSRLTLEQMYQMDRRVELQVTRN
jgi:outer membrane protein OmpA-like peptidoglycan-associated protein